MIYADLEVDAGCQSFDNEEYAQSQSFNLDVYTYDETDEEDGRDDTDIGSGSDSDICPSSEKGKCTSGGGCIVSNTEEYYDIPETPAWDFDIYTSANIEPDNDQVSDRSESICRVNFVSNSNEDDNDDDDSGRVRDDDDDDDASDLEDESEDDCLDDCVKTDYPNG